MSNPRPYPQTDWEEEQQHDADLAVENAEAAVLHADAAVADIMKSTKEIAASTTAVENLTRDALIADNKRFRRRNFILVFLTSMLIIGMGYMIYRDVFVNAPARDRIVKQTNDLEDANKKLDEINAFIEEVQADNRGETSPELQAVFDAVFETKQMIECVIIAPDQEAVRGCAIPES